MTSVLCVHFVARQMSIGTQPSTPENSPVPSRRLSVNLAGVFSSNKLAVRLLARKERRREKKEKKKETDFHVSVKELEDEGRWIIKRRFRVRTNCNQSY